MLRSNLSKIDKLKNKSETHYYRSDQITYNLSKNDYLR